MWHNIMDQLIDVLTLYHYTLSLWSPSTSECLMTAQGGEAIEQFHVVSVFNELRDNQVLTLLYYLGEADSALLYQYYRRRKKSSVNL